LKYALFKYRVKLNLIISYVIIAYLFRLYRFPIFRAGPPALVSSSPSHNPGLGRGRILIEVPLPVALSFSGEGPTPLNKKIGVPTLPFIA
jgi:hypothetical protein